MTLDLKKYLENLIKKEAKISHFSVRVNAGKKERLMGNILRAIQADYGETFLNDANYILFFSRDEGWTDKDIQKVFDLTDRALGKNANKLSKADFKKLSNSTGPAEMPDDIDDDDFDDEDIAEEPVNTDTSNTLFVKITIK